MMAIDCRDRISGVHSNSAGNYVLSPFLQNADLQTPATVRAWLNARMAPGNPLPEVTYKRLRSFVPCVHTNWSRFYNQVEIDGWNHKLHFPVMRFETNIGPVQMGIEMHLITFMSSKNQISGFFLTKRKELTLEF